MSAITLAGPVLVLLSQRQRRCRDLPYVQDHSGRHDSEPQCQDGQHGAATSRWLPSNRWVASRTTSASSSTRQQRTLGEWAGFWSPEARAYHHAGIRRQRERSQDLAFQNVAPPVTARRTVRRPPWLTAQADYTGEDLSAIPSPIAATGWLHRRPHLACADLRMVTVTIHVVYTGIAGRCSMTPTPMAS
jgi:hypothetical protein